MNKLTFVLVCIAACLRGQTISKPVELDPRTKVQSYTIQQTEVYTMLDGSINTQMPMEQSKRVFARNSAGSRMAGNTFPTAFPDLPGWHTRYIWSTPTVDISVSDAQRTKTTMTHPYAARDNFSSAANNRCEMSLLKFIDYQDLQGIRAAHLIGDNPEEVREVWAWPEADCIALQERHRWKNPDGSPMNQITFDRLDSVVIGEPDPALFEVPTDYAEKPRGVK